MVGRALDRSGGHWARPQDSQGLRRDPRPSHILPAFGGLKLRALHRRHIKDFLARKRAGGLSKNSVRLIRATLSVLLSDAVDDGILLANPAQGVTRRGRKGPDTITQAERQRKILPLTGNQLETFLGGRRWNDRAVNGRSS